MGRGSGGSELGSVTARAIPPCPPPGGAPTSDAHWPPGAVPEAAGSVPRSSDLDGRTPPGGRGSGRPFAVIAGLAGKGVGVPAIAGAGGKTDDGGPAASGDAGRIDGSGEGDDRGGTMAPDSGEGSGSGRLSGDGWGDAILGEGPVEAVTGVPGRELSADEGGVMPWYDDVGTGGVGLAPATGGWGSELARAGAGWPVGIVGRLGECRDRPPLAALDRDETDELVDDGKGDSSDGFWVGKRGTDPARLCTREGAPVAGAPPAAPVETEGEVGVPGSEGECEGEAYEDVGGLEIE